MKYKQKNKPRYTAGPQSTKPLEHRSNCGCLSCRDARVAYDLSQDIFRKENIAERARLNPGRLADTWAAAHIPHGERVPVDGADFSSMTDHEANHLGMRDGVIEQIMGYMLKKQLILHFDGMSLRKAFRRFTTLYPHYGHALYLVLGEQRTAAEAGRLMDPPRDERTVRIYVTHGKFWLRGFIEGLDFDGTTLPTD